MYPVYLPSSGIMHAASLVIVIRSGHCSSRIRHGHDDYKRFILMLCPRIYQLMCCLFYAYVYRQL